MEGNKIQCNITNSTIIKFDNKNNKNKDKSKNNIFDDFNNIPNKNLEKIINQNYSLQKKINKKYFYLNNNIYLNNPPDFKLLSESFPNFAKYVFKNKFNGYSIKWSDKNALKELNRTLLKKDFDIDYWDIPDGFLIPTITSRLNYICWVKSLLDGFIYKDSEIERENKENMDSISYDDKSRPNLLKKKRINYQQTFLNNLIKKRKTNIYNPITSINDYLSEEKFEEKIMITGLDIGTGANCIYPLLGYGMYKWHFKATDINNESLESAYNIIERNNLENLIKLETQINEKYIFYSVVEPQEIIYFSMCNPPYFDYNEEKSDNPHTVKF